MPMLRPGVIKQRTQTPNCVICFQIPDNNPVLKQYMEQRQRLMERQQEEKKKVEGQCFISIRAAVTCRDKLVFCSLELCIILELFV